jgi:hypothetical protein
MNKQQGAQAVENDTAGSRRSQPLVAEPSPTSWT